MDLTAKKLGLSENNLLVVRAAELRRQADILFDSSVIGVGEVCKDIICLEMAASENKLDIRELAIQFGCIRLIPIVQKGLEQFKERFVTSLPPSRRLSADFTRPVFTAVAFYLCAKKHKLKVDKIKIIEICRTSESEFSSVSTSMKDLCFDVFGLPKEKKDAEGVQGN